MIRAILLPFLLTASAPAPKEPAPVISHEPVVKVECGLGWGSAVSVGNNWYATAAHVVKQGGCSVKGVPVTNVTIDDKTDFAVFSAGETPAAVMNCDGFKPEEFYYATGYPGVAGGSFIVTEVWYASPMKDEFGMTMFVGNGYPGMSGGPVRNGAGEVVGVVNMRWPTRSTPLSNTVLCKGK